MKRRLCAAIALASAMASLAIAPAFAERRVALVIGNAAYQFVPRLRTPTSDSDHVADLLRRLDFQVTEAKDLDKLGMEQALRRFAEEISGADVALFYFSGHGAQLSDDSYILPTSARVDNQRSLALDTFPVLSIDSMMRSAGAHVQLLFLDACRDNPFASRFAPTQTVTTRGLAPIEPSGGALIAFSAGPGQVARDGTGEVSPFTEAFLKFADIPNVEVRQMLARVRGYVSQQTDQDQMPWDNSSLLKEFYFVPKRLPLEFQQLTRVRLAANGSGPLRLTRPKQPDGGVVRIRIEQTPASGRLLLGDQELAAGAEFDASMMEKLAYRGSGGVASDAFSFRASDEWGHSDVGLVSIEFTGEAPVSAPAPETPQAMVDASLNAISLIGLGPNLRFRDVVPASANATTNLRLAEDPSIGQFRLGERVIGKDRTVSVAELPHLSFLPPVGGEGTTVKARFVVADGSPGAINLKIDVEVTDCDRLAGDRLDQQGVTAGVYAGRVDTDAALPACELAVKLQPKLGRFVYELGRVYAALGRNAEAETAYHKAADLGHVRAVWALGYRALYIPPVDPALGLKLLEQAQAAGDVHADHTLGQAYYEGRGVPKDWVKARILFEKAAQAGLTFSMNSLGGMYERGETVDADRALARRYFEESAARGDVYGLDNLGYVYLNGVGVAKDPAQALVYFRKASDLGHPEAPNNIGRLYLLGQGVPKNVEEARRWYELGMTRGDAWAAYNLGELTRDGVGGPVDKVKAGYYFARASAASNRPDPAELGRKALLALDPQTKLGVLRMMTIELDPTAGAATDQMLPDLARKSIAKQNVKPADASSDALLIALGQALFLAKGARTDLF